MVATKKTTKKAPVKKSAVKTTAKKPAHPGWKTGKVGPDVHPFFSFHITSQTIIWAIVMIFVLIVQLAILFKEIDILNALS